MSVCSSGVQRRKKLENKQKFVFNEKDVVPLPRANVKPSSLQERLARARAGKDGRPPRFDPVLDEVAAKLEKEVARIKLGETSATEIRDCLKAQSASLGGKAGCKVPGNFGSKLPAGVNNMKLRVPVVDEEKAVKEKAGAKETNLVKEAALLKEANIVKEMHLTKLAHPSKVTATSRETHPSKEIVPVKVTATVPVKKVTGNANAVPAAKEKTMVKEKMVKEKIVVKDCPCLRPLRLIMCADCGVTFAGRLRAECSTHPRALFLQDVSACSSCKQADVSKLMEFDLPAGMEESLRKL